MEICIYNIVCVAAELLTAERLSNQFKMTHKQLFTLLKVCYCKNALEVGKGEHYVFKCVVSVELSRI